MPETRVIDATRLHEQVFNDNGGDLSKTENVAQILLRIENAPTVDVKPVKRGHWITTQKTIDDNITTCSNCKREFYIEDLVEVGNDDGYCEFCPNCGAEMNGGKSNGDSK